MLHILNNKIMKKSLIVIISVLFSVSTLFASESAKFHSGFIYHFTKYIEWPEAMRNGNFVIAVVGDSDVSQYLEELAKTKTVGTQKIVIKKCKSVAEAKGSHIIYLSDSKIGDFDKQIHELKDLIRDVPKTQRDLLNIERRIQVNEKM